MAPPVAENVAIAARYCIWNVLGVLSKSWLMAFTVNEYNVLAATEVMLPANTPVELLSVVSGGNAVVFEYVTVVSDVATKVVEKVSFWLTLASVVPVVHVGRTWRMHVN